VVIERKIRRIFVVTALLIGINFTAFAHPHVFIDAQINVHFNNKGICGIGVQWYFDEMFTELMLQEYDTDANGSFDKVEQKRLYDEAFINLEKSDYFTHIYEGNNKVKYNDITGFSVSIDNGQMIYKFYIPLSIDIPSNSSKIINIYSFDESYYMDMVLSSSNPVSYSNANNFDVSFVIEEDENRAYYFSQIYPQVVRIKVNKR